MVNSAQGAIYAKRSLYPSGTAFYVIQAERSKPDIRYHATFDELEELVRAILGQGQDWRIADEQDFDEIDV